MAVCLMTITRKEILKILLFFVIMYVTSLFPSLHIYRRRRRNKSREKTMNRLCICECL